MCKRVDKDRSPLRFAGPRVGLPAWTNLSVTSANQARLEQAYMIRGARRCRLRHRSGEMRRLVQSRVVALPAYVGAAADAGVDTLVRQLLNRVTASRVL